MLKSFKNMLIVGWSLNCLIFQIAYFIGNPSEEVEKYTPSFTSSNYMQGFNYFTVHLFTQEHCKMNWYNLRENLFIILLYSK